MIYPRFIAVINEEERMKKKQYLFNKETRVDYLMLALKAKRMGLPTVEKAWKNLAQKTK